MFNPCGGGGTSFGAHPTSPRFKRFKPKTPMSRNPTCVLRRAGALPALLAGFACSVPALAQGQDSTPTEHNTQVVADRLARVYDNSDQVYLDRRLAHLESERHSHLEIRVDRVGDPDSMLLSEQAFTDGDYSRLTRTGSMLR